MALLRQLRHLLLALLAWPAWGADWPAATGSWADVSNAVRNASDGDFVSIPAGSNVWNGRLKIDKAITVRGFSSNVVGGTIINLDPTGPDGPTDAIFLCLKAWTCISNMYLRGTDGATQKAWAVAVMTNNILIRGVYFTHCLNPVAVGGFGLVSHCIFVNNERMGRCHGMGNLNGNISFNSTKWPETFGLTNGFGSTSNFWANTNFMVFEDNFFFNDANFAPSGRSPQAVITSQEGQMWIARHNYIELSSWEMAPAFDTHGALDTVTYGGFTVQVYSNIFKMNSGGLVQKLLDIRGGSGVCYSNWINTAFGGYVSLRDGDSPGFFFDNGPPITNTWIWANFTNSGANWAFPVSDQPTTNVVNQTYFTNAPPTIYQMAYPDPLWTYFVPAASGPADVTPGAISPALPPVGARRFF